MASQDTPNMDNGDLSSVSDSPDYRRSGTSVQEMTTPVSETQEAGSRPLGDHVREGKHIGIAERLQLVDLGGDSIPLKHFKQAAINPSGSDLLVGPVLARSPYPVQEKPKQLQALPENNTEIQLIVSEQEQGDAVQNPSDDTNESSGHDKQSCSGKVLDLEPQSADYDELSKIFVNREPEKIPATEEITKKKEMEEDQAEIKSLIKKLDAKVCEHGKQLTLVEKSTEERFRATHDYIGFLALQMEVVKENIGLSPDSIAEKAWKELLSQSVDQFEPGMFFEVNPLIISYECSTRPNGKALVFVRESFRGLLENIMSVHNAHWAQPTASVHDSTTSAARDRMESNPDTGSTTATDQTNPIATATERHTDESPASTTTAIATPITGNKDEATPITSPGNKFLVAGTPGTGKSCFAYYLLPHLLVKEGDSVLYQNCHKDMKFLVIIRRSKGGFEIEHYPMPTNSLPKHKQGFLGKGKVSDSAEKPVSWYIFDSGHKSAAKPESTDVPTIVISSPDCDQYKDFMLKGPEKFYMPTWEWLEIDAVVRQLHPDKSAQMNASVKEAKDDYTVGKIRVAKKQERIEGARRSFSERFSAYGAFKMHGGVVRDVLNPCSEGRLHAAVNQSNVDMVLQFLHARGDVSSAVSHRILHQKCDKKLENGCVDYQKPTICFASEYVHDRLWDKHLQKKADLKIEQLSLMYELIPADKSTHSEECRRKFGDKFEELVHTTIARGPHEAKKLFSQTDKAKNKLKTIPLEFTSKIIRPSLYKKADDHIVCTIDTKPEDKEAYVRPSKGHFPAFDAFLPNQKYLLQITITKNHPVAVPELMSFIASRRWSPKDVTLVFMVLDKIYDSFPHQVPKNIRDCTPDEIEGFKKIRQCALPMPPRQLLHKQ